jgi:predicted DNA-binding transcriptional regulator YafY
MLGDLQRYMNSGQLVEIIYLDRHGRTSKRTVRIHEISSESLLLCASGVPRILR